MCTTLHMRVLTPNTQPFEADRLLVVLYVHSFLHARPVHNENLPGSPVSPGLAVQDSLPGLVLGNTGFALRRLFRVADRVRYAMRTDRLSMGSNHESCNGWDMHRSASMDVEPCNDCHRRRPDRPFASDPKALDIGRSNFSKDWVSTALRYVLEYQSSLTFTSTSLCAVFSMGLVATAFSFVRLKYVDGFETNPNPTRLYAYVGIYSNLEVSGSTWR